MTNKVLPYELVILGMDGEWIESYPTKKAYPKFYCHKIGYDRFEVIENDTKQQIYVREGQWKIIKNRLYGNENKT